MYFALALLRFCSAFVSLVLGFGIVVLEFGDGGDADVARRWGMVLVVGTWGLALMVLMMGFVLESEMKKRWVFLFSLDRSKTDS